MIGPRKRLLTKYITTNPISAATREIYRKNWFDSAALSVMLEKEAALEDAKKQEIACLFDLKVIPKTMTDGYESWWNVGIATTSSKESVRKACVGVLEGRREARDY